MNIVEANPDSVLFPEDNTVSLANNRSCTDAERMAIVQVCHVWLCAWRVCALRVCHVTVCHVWVCAVSVQAVAADATRRVHHARR
eukprot:3001494-Rhodomonas_salina.1